MPIQFSCPSCSQPIEVDDEHAGQSAACPYCRRVVTVPTETTLSAPASTVARPPGSPPSQPSCSTAPPSPPLPGAGFPQVGAAPDSRDQTARAYANYALICSGITLVLFCVTMVYAITLIIGQLGGMPATQPSPEQMAQAQAEVMKILSGKAWVLGTRVGGAFFAVAGLALGIVALRQSTRTNWKAIISVILCSLLTLCTCGDLLMSFGAAAAGAPGISAP